MKDFGLGHHARAICGDAIELEGERETKGQWRQAQEDARFRFFRVCRPSALLSPTI